MTRSIASRIIETARALGMDPGTLATIMSYETGGTFDPSQPGPVTKWGRHRGLIQFGEPQAREFGVDWDNPVESQLGENGAVAKYFRARGWRPGMSELDAYSIVNAGAPGRYNAVDHGTTVREKVEAQFGPHREKAFSFLEGEWNPEEGSLKGQDRRKTQVLPIVESMLSGLFEEAPREDRGREVSQEKALAAAAAQLMQREQERKQKMKADRQGVGGLVDSFGYGEIRRAARGFR